MATNSSQPAAQSYYIWRCPECGEQASEGASEQSWCWNPIHKGQGGRSPLERVRVVVTPKPDREKLVGAILDVHGYHGDDESGWADRIVDAILGAL